MTKKPQIPRPYKTTIARNPVGATTPVAAPETIESQKAQEAAVARVNEVLGAKNNDLGMKLLQQYCNEFPHTSWFPYRLSILYYELGRRTEALTTLEAVCQKEPDNPDYAMALGTFYYDNPERDFQKALKNIGRALELKPFEQQSWRNYGVILYKYGEVQKGFNALFRALQLDPNDFVTTNALCMYLTEQGRREEGKTFGALGLQAKHNNAMQEFARANVPPELKTLKPKPPRRAGMKNVFSFSLWGQDETYTIGAVENAKMMGQFFPGWVVRVYHNDTVPADIIKQIQQAGGETVAMTGAYGELNPGMWRFLVANDPSVYYFCVRDADCRPFLREQAAVEAWLASGKSFHMMRDDIWHNEVMLAGLWGGTAGMLPDMVALINTHFQKSTNRWHDQIMLKNFIWPMIYQDSMQHDNYYHLFGAQPYPIPRVEGDPMHVGYGHKPKPSDKVYNVVKQVDESIDAMLERLWQENLNRDNNLQELEVADPTGNKYQLKRLPGTGRYQVIRSAGLVAMPAGAAPPPAAA